MRAISIPLVLLFSLVIEPGVLHNHPYGREAIVRPVGTSIEELAREALP